MIYDQDKIEAYANKFILYLYQNQDKELRFTETFEYLKIEQSYRIAVQSQMEFPVKLFEGEYTIKDPKIKLTKKGVAFAENLLDTHFEETGEALPQHPLIETNIEGTCELIFQLHKKAENFRVFQSRDTYKNFPTNTPAAREKLIHEKIINPKQHGKQKFTYLNPDLFNANSYAEAAVVIRQKDVHAPTVNFGGHNYGVTMFNS